MSKTKEPKNELAVIVKGEIIESNFEEFAAKVDAHLATINTDLKTDADFGKAKDDAKGLRSAEKNMKGIKVDLLEQLESVNDLFSKLDDKQESVRVKALELENLIKTKTAEVKKEIVDTALAMISVSSREIYRFAVTSTMKGKSKLDSMREGAVKCAASIEDRHTQSKVIIDEFVAANGASIAPDASKLLDDDSSELREKLTHRVELAKADAEKKRLADELAEAKRVGDARDEAERLEAEKRDAENLKAFSNPVTGIPVTEANTTPEPRKVDSIPTTTPDLVLNEDETEKEEFDRFCKTALETFWAVKIARKALKHQRNIEAAEDFANNLANAWKKFSTLTY